MAKIDTVSLLKTYITFTVLVLIFSLTLFHFKNNSNSQIIVPISNTKETDTPPLIVPSSSLIEGTTSKEVALNQNASQPTPVPPSSNQLNEIDIIEIDTRAHIPNPCISPITYTLGTFDTRFGISKNYFLQKINESASLWNNAADKELLKYNQTKTSNGVIVNLVYDGRQARTDDTKLIILEIENSRNVAIDLKKEYEAQKNDFDMRKEFYMQRVDAFNIRQKVYTDSVSSWNEKGGAPREEYDKLTSEKEWLMREAEYLTKEQQDLNVVLTEINAKIARYNELVTFSNERVTTGNQYANKKFTEGKYNPNTGEITIYQFSDEIKLRRVLAHEFGHALGIDHTKSKDSIMHAINSATSTGLNYEDIQEVQALCQ